MTSAGLTPIYWREKKSVGNPYVVPPHRKMFTENGYVSKGVRYDRDYVVQYFKRSLKQVYPCKLSAIIAVIKEAMANLAEEN
jgi:hypothetical protein